MVFKPILIAFVVFVTGPLFFGSADAGPADVVDVEVSKTAPNTYRFDVTVKHGDEGWDHYADRWDVVAPDGSILGTRILHHPHVEEQPFTRSDVIKVPAGVKSVIVRAGDKVHGLGGEAMTVVLPE